MWNVILAILAFIVICYALWLLIGTAIGLVFFAISFTVKFIFYGIVASISYIICSIYRLLMALLKAIYFKIRDIIKDRLHRKETTKPVNPNIIQIANYRQKMLIKNKILVPALIKKQKPKVVLTDEFKEILSILENTTTSIFISGKAGTGKSTLLKHFTQHTKKKYVILAPTGVAALNVGGQTIHSFFRFPIGFLNKDNIKPDFTRNNLFRNLQMVIIDEISMVRADIMDGIDYALRINRNQLDKPFGGVQMVFIGDLFQLPPVVPNGLREYFNTFYKSEYFFAAKVFENFKYQFRELTHVFRQKNETFFNLLNKIRLNEAGFDDFCLLNSRYIDNVPNINNKMSIFLTTTNANAKRINNDRLEKIPHPEKVYQAILEGSIAKYYDLNKTEDEQDSRFPADVSLKLKKDAQIMMVKNDPGKRWVNGTLGIIERLADDYIVVKIDSNTYRVEREKWEEIEYRYNTNTKKIEEQSKGIFKQFPVKLAWAITIHKSQGKTFDNIIIDVGNGAFAHGQTYVALSRCRSLEGIILNRPVEEKDIIVDNRVVQFFRERLM